MIIDSRGEMCSATALNTGAAGTYLIGSQIDLGVDGLDVGVGEDLYLVIQVTTTATSGGSATGQFKLASDASAAISTTTSTVHFVTDAIAVATLVAGYRVAAVRLPSGTYERYLGILQVTGTAAFTAGAIDAFLTKDISAWTAYADAVN